MAPCIASCQRMAPCLGGGSDRIGSWHVRWRLWAQRLHSLTGTKIGRPHVLDGIRKRDFPFPFLHEALVL